jgi:diacylglycerol kinase (ATP)
VAVTAPGGSVSAQGTGEVIPDDGLLDVTIQTCDNSVLQSLNAMIHLLKAAVIKEPTQTDNILHMRVKELEIVSKSKQNVVVDGELISKKKKHFHFQVLPKALNVIAPPAQPPTTA